MVIRLDHIIIGNGNGQKTCEGLNIVEKWGASFYGVIMKSRSFLFLFSCRAEIGGK